MNNSQKSSISPRFNLDLLEEYHSRWLKDSTSVDASWANFFQGFEIGIAQPKPKNKSNFEDSTDKPYKLDNAEVTFRAQIVNLIYAHQTLGHTQAAINPLRKKIKRNPSLSLDFFGFREDDLQRQVRTIFFRNGEIATLQEIIEYLERVYCGSIGAEFYHIHKTNVRVWLRQKLEDRQNFEDQLTTEQLTNAYHYLIEGELFENFLAKQFLGEKRFSLEGGEGALILLNAILENSPAEGVEEIQMGMSHRGRINILANFIGKKLAAILSEFSTGYIPDIATGDGDVRYHLGYANTRKVGGEEVLINLAANPSHLESVNAIVEGKTRARQRVLKDDGRVSNRIKVLPLLLHGDAAFSGQGSVAEVLNLSQLSGYRTGGTIHLIINNQIGFTTTPNDARSSSYATDVAKMIGAPILHVNGEDPRALIWAGKTALEFRQKFSRDIVIDMYCYRRQGHNETDQAAFTQPLIVKQIKNQPLVSKTYEKWLLNRKMIAPEVFDNLKNKIEKRFHNEFKQMEKQNTKKPQSVFLGSTGVEQLSYSNEAILTGVKKEVLVNVGKALVSIPEDFSLHITLKKRFLARRIKALKEQSNIDWALAESLAWGSLLLEGHPIRLSGQDCRRGTFSQRHAVFYDTETRKRYIPLDEFSKDNAHFRVYNSLLSEAAVLGFDYGYSIGCPDMLIMWEAQFGDFANGAQVIIDQFVASAESKWQTPSGIVMLLPHGYEGMGPEHSSARLERFLQLCAEDNMYVANLTTPAQYFHLLRRQLKQSFRKPLILMTPKSLLTHPEVVSSFDDLSGETSFQEILGDPKEMDPKKIKRVIFCSGKVYYDLLEYRESSLDQETLIIRIEQLYPLHREKIVELLVPCESINCRVWCQEEPLNMGGWTYVAPQLEKLLSQKIYYSGRKTSASPAVGSKAQHLMEQESLVKNAFELTP